MNWEFDKPLFTSNFKNSITQAEHFFFRRDAFLFAFWATKQDLRQCIQVSLTRLISRAGVSSLTVISVQLANNHSISYPWPKPETWVQRPSKLCLVPMDEGRLVVWDAVKAQNPHMLVQVNADPSGLGCAQHLFLVIVPEREAGSRPVQSPRQGVMAHAAAVISSIPRHLLISYTNGHLDGGRKR